MSTTTKPKTMQDVLRGMGIAVPSQPSGKSSKPPLSDDELVAAIFAGRTDAAVLNDPRCKAAARKIARREPGMYRED